MQFVNEQKKFNGIQSQNSVSRTRIYRFTR